MGCHRMCQSVLFYKTLYITHAEFCKNGHCVLFTKHSYKTPLIDIIGQYTHARPIPWISQIEYCNKRGMWRSLAPPTKSINACYDKNGKMDSSRFRLFQRSNRIKFARHYSRMMERTSEEEVEEKVHCKHRDTNLEFFMDFGGCQ